MRLIKTAACCGLSWVAAIVLCIPASGQGRPKDRSPVGDIFHGMVSDSLPVRQWLVSANPLGLLEAPAAIGAGIGYRLSRKVELWSETSLLRKGIVPDMAGASGIRQTLQLKRFVNQAQSLFIAAELRYKAFSFRDSARFYSSSTNDTLSFRGYRDHHSFWGAGLQAGGRWSLSKRSHFQLELTAGLGIKYKTIRYDNVPAGFKPSRKGIDINFRDFMDHPGWTIYLPGSLRLIYIFGKRIL